MSDVHEPAIESAASPDPARDAYTIREAAARLGVAVTTLYGIVQRGELPHTRVGNCLRIRPRDLHQYLDARTSSTWRRVDRRGRRPRGSAT